MCFLYLYSNHCVFTDPFDPNPNNDNFNVDGTVEESDETDQTGVIIGIIAGIIFISILIVFCTKLKGYKVLGSIYESCCGCFEQCYAGCCGCFECCYGGFLGILRIFDIRRYFRNEDSGYVFM